MNILGRVVVTQFGVPAVVVGFNDPYIILEFDNGTFGEFPQRAIDWVSPDAVPVSLTLLRLCAYYQIAEYSDRNTHRMGYKNYSKETAKACLIRVTEGDQLFNFN